MMHRHKDTDGWHPRERRDTTAGTVRFRTDPDRYVNEGREWSRHDERWK